MKALLLSAVAAVCLSAPAGAAILHVPKDFPTIQAAVDAAENGDTVLVAPGHYPENLAVLGKSLSLVSSDGPKQTTIDGGGSGPVVTIDQSESALLEGFTITNGNSDLGGGGVRCIVSTVTIRGNVITENFASRGGGIHSIGSTTTVVDNELSNNLGSGFWSAGGAIFCQAGEVEATSNVVENNRCQGFLSGGGAFGNRDGGFFVATRNLFHGNSTDGVGGAVSAYDDFVLHENQFIGNSSLGEGGAIVLLGGHPIAISITGNLFVGNSAGAFGGAIYGGGDINTNISENTFVLNEQGFGPSSGAIHMNTESSSQLITSNVVAYTGSGWGIRCFTSTSVGCNVLYENPTGGISFAGGCVDLGGNVETDPEFCDLEQGNYSVASTSPCLPGQHPTGRDCGQIGAFGQGCGPTPVARTTWGELKSRYLR